MFRILFFVFRVYKNVVKVADNEDVKVFFKDVINYALKRCGYINLSERYN